MTQFGTLYLVATPIGNLEDITFRAIRVLGEVDLIAAEDTRQTLKLLNHFNISKPLTSFFKHNEGKKGQAIIEKLKCGQNIALVSDAGTPGISDPGEELIADAIKEGIRVVPIPGPVAAIAGITASGLPTGRFVFEGFLPMNKRARKERLEEIKNESRTMIFYEAPHKLTYTLKDMLSEWGDRKIVIAREITKLFEEIKQTSISEEIENYQSNKPKGEFVIIVEGAVKAEEKIEQTQEKAVAELFQEYLRQGMERKEAMKKIAKERKTSKSEIYNQILTEKKDPLPQ